MSIPYLVVHGGAGNHSESSEAAAKRALRRACKSALQDACSAVDLVERAISILEDDPCLNAGFGSNLTLDGTVECDASIIDGKHQAFGAVGAVQGIKHPIALARQILINGRSPDLFGRIAPLMLVSDAARKFGATRLDPAQFIAPDALIHAKARESWTRWTALINADDEAIVPQSDIQDTVGAVAFDNSGVEDIAAGVSSGGLLLKHPGRIGEAAFYGAGCWAQRATCEIDGSPQSLSVACSVSGAGEHIMRVSLAKSVGSSVLDAMSTDDDVHQIIERAMLDFWNETKLREDHPNAGIILVTASGTRDDERKVRLWCAFTTPSMAIAYISPSSPTPKAVVLRQPTGTGEGSHPSIYITAMPL